jgi:hypothetical protein
MAPSLSEAVAACSSLRILLMAFLMMALMGVLLLLPIVMEEP